MAHRAAHSRPCTGSDDSDKVSADSLALLMRPEVATVSSVRMDIDAYTRLAVLRPVSRTVPDRDAARTPLSVEYDAWSLDEESAEWAWSDGIYAHRSSS